MSNSVTVFKNDNAHAHALPASDVSALRAAVDALEGVNDERTIALRRQLLAALNSPDDGVEKADSTATALRDLIARDSAFIEQRAVSLRKADANLGLADALAVAHREPEVKAAAERMRKLDEVAEKVRAASAARPRVLNQLRKAEARSDVLSLSERVAELRKSHDGMNDTEAYSRAVQEQRLGLSA